MSRTSRYRTEFRDASHGWPYQTPDECTWTGTARPKHSDGGPAVSGLRARIMIPRDFGLAIGDFRAFGHGGWTRVHMKRALGASGRPLREAQQSSGACRSLAAIAQGSRRRSGRAHHRLFDYPGSPPPRDRHRPEPTPICDLGHTRSRRSMERGRPQRCPFGQCSGTSTRSPGCEVRVASWEQRVASAPRLLPTRETWMQAHDNEFPPRRASGVLWDLEQLARREP
jgi:hypothetical protein